MTRNVYAANSSRFYDTRPIKVYTDYEDATGKFLNLAVTDYTYEDSAEVERTTANLAPFQKPKDVLVLPDFSQEDGTMTATLKVRRFKVKELYRKEIEEFLEASGEQVATKKDLAIPSSRIVESLEAGTVIVGVDNVVK